MLIVVGNFNSLTDDDTDSLKMLFNLQLDLVGWQVDKNSQSC